MVKIKHKNTFARAKGLFPFVDWKDKKVLDWGGNIGSLLTSSEGEIKQENYTCVDVSSEAVEHGKIEYPYARWIHWNAFNPVYNPEGTDKTFETNLGKYDIIFSHSVFTHTSVEDFFTANENLKKHINVNGVICHTYLSTTRSKFFLENYMYSKRVKDYGECYSYSCFDDIEDYCYLINNAAPTQEFPKGYERYVITLFNENFLQAKYPNATLTISNQRWQNGFSLQY